MDALTSHTLRVACLLFIYSCLLIIYPCLVLFHSAIFVRQTNSDIEMSLPSNVRNEFSLCDVDGRGTYVDTFYWRLLLVSSPTHIFAERCVFSSALASFSLKIQRRALRCNRGRFNCWQRLRRYCDLRQYLFRLDIRAIEINRNLIQIQRSAEI